MAALLAEFAKHYYQFRELVGCLARHQAPRDANRQVVGEGKWHMQILGHLCLHSRGDPPNIKNERAFDIMRGKDLYHANIQASRNHTDAW